MSIKNTQETAVEINRLLGRDIVSSRMLTRWRTHGRGPDWVRLEGRWYTTDDARTAWLRQCGVLSAGSDESRVAVG